jgi:hypothetical protein
MQSHGRTGEFKRCNEPLQIFSCFCTDAVYSAWGESGPGIVRNIDFFWKAHWSGTNGQAIHILLLVY